MSARGTNSSKIYMTATMLSKPCLCIPINSSFIHALLTFPWTCIHHMGMATRHKCNRTKHNQTFPSIQCSKSLLRPLWVPWCDLTSHRLFMADKVCHSLACLKVYRCSQLCRTTTFRWTTQWCSNPSPEIPTKVAVECLSTWADQVACSPIRVWTAQCTRITR